MIDGPQSSNVQMSVAHAMHCVLARLGLGGGHAVQPVLPTLQLWPLMPPTTAASGPTVNVRIVSLPRLSFLIFFIAVPPCGPSRRAGRRVPSPPSSPPGARRGADRAAPRRDRRRVVGRDVLEPARDCALATVAHRDRLY